MKKINGTYHLLMQLKIEPGNLKVIQISPTIQATKSNFEKRHGGKKTLYIDDFLDTSNSKIIVDQLQSEQGARFYKKRNRNIVILTEKDIHVEPNFMWMTIKQLKQLLLIDNLVNMTTRSVLPLIPYEYIYSSKDLIVDKSLRESLFSDNSNISSTIFSYINDVKMLDKNTIKTVPLYDLKSWEITDNEIMSKQDYNYRIVYCDVEIEGREVEKWNQPLLESENTCLFGLFTRVINQKREFLINVRREIGCFDIVELGPTVQIENYQNSSKLDNISKLFLDMYLNKKGISVDVTLSEEGGRFLYEENVNSIIDITDKLLDLPKGYFWVDLKTLKDFLKIDNIINIQLRSILSILEV